MDDFIALRPAFPPHTESMRHERDIVKAITGPRGFRPSFTLDELDATVDARGRILIGEQ